MFIIIEHFIWFFQIWKSIFYILHFYSIYCISLRRYQCYTSLSSFVMFHHYSHLIRLEFVNLRCHKIVEVRVESIHRTVDAHSDIIFAHFIQQRRYSCAHQMRRSSGYYWTNVSHVLAILIAHISQSQFGQYFPTVCVSSLRIAKKNS